MDHKVIVYSTPTCPYCTMAKTYLSEQNVPFEDHNVAVDHQKAQEMIQKSGQMGVPVIDIDGNVIVGFDRGAMKSLLGL